MADGPPPPPGAGPAPGDAGILQRPARGELLRDARLWITVGLVAVFALAWQVAFLFSGHPISVTSADFLPLGVFLVPVLYASVSFGLGGGLVVATVATVATLPWMARSLEHQDPTGAWLDFAQVLVVVVVAYFVGRAVRAERRARRASEQSWQGHLLAEVRYRDLFETNSQPILLVDMAGVVHEANVAAGELFGRAASSLVRTTLPELIGPEVSTAVRKGDPSPGTLEIAGSNGSPAATLRPAARMVAIDGHPMMQVVLQDVTEDARRRQQAQAYAADVVRGQEDERRRIAQELHDGPLQTLVHVCRLVDAVSGSRPASTPGPASGEGGGPPALVQLRTAAESAVAEIRRISRGLRPPLLDDLGLVAALERLCDDVEQRAGVAASLRVEGVITPLAPAVELTVFRVAQEALSNVDRHAGAASVDVRVTTACGWLQLKVTDDGQGFELRPAGTAPGGERLGLPGMAERAELVGGSLEVCSAPGEGTTVTLTVPAGAPRVQPPRSGGVPRVPSGGAG